MISAVVLVDFDPAAESTRTREHVVRSLVWLVSAAVAGVVRDVVLASPPAFDLADIADQAGCALIQDDTETALLTEAVAHCRCDWVLVVRSGYQPDGLMIEELDGLVAPHRAIQPALVLASPETLFQRLFPARTPAVGVLCSRNGVPERVTFRSLVRALGRSNPLHTRMRPIP